MKCRTFSGSAFDIYGPAVVIADALDDSKPDAQTLALGCSAEETLIEKWQIKWLDANAGIGNRKPVLIEIHANKTALGILHRIAKQIHESGMQCLPDSM